MCVTSDMASLPLGPHHHQPPQPAPLPLPLPPQQQAENDPPKTAPAGGASNMETDKVNFPFSTILSFYAAHRFQPPFLLLRSSLIHRAILRLSLAFDDLPISVNSPEFSPAKITVVLTSTVAL